MAASMGMAGKDDRKKIDRELTREETRLGRRLAKAEQKVKTAAGRRRLDNARDAAVSEATKAAILESRKARRTKTK